MNSAEESFEGDEQSEAPVTCRSFIKWVGGKSQLRNELVRRAPRKFRRYYEPFVGGGALFFALQPRQAILADLNEELINAYTVVRDQSDDLIEALAGHVYEEEYFYSIRNIDRTPEYLRWSPVAKAGRFIYLNKTCFNGLYRVNSKGFFNTPFGRYTNPTILDRQNLKACSQVLMGVDLRVADFLAIEETVSLDDFVYFDPPYVPLSSTSSFTSYQSGGFGIEMQQALLELCYRLDKRGIRFMLSNSSAPAVFELYKKFHIERVGATRAINSKALKRGVVDEVIVRNYQ